MRWLIFAVLFFPLAGCGGQGGIDLSDRIMRSSPRRLEGRTIAATPLRIPADEPFNIHEPISQQADNGKAHASAEPSGKAACRAEAHDIGSAEAQFQLGHKFDLRDDRPIAVTIKVNTEGNVRRELSGDDPDSSTEAGLAVHIRDTRGTVVRNEAILTGDRCSIQGAFQRLTQFELLLEPDRGYYVVVAGKVKASAAGKQRASASIEVRSVGLEIALNPDAAVPSTTTAPHSP